MSAAPVAAWWLAMRPKTLPAAVVPVFVGSACALGLARFQWLPSIAALAGALLLQIGSNFANDVYDYEKGADTGARLGPTRAVQAGLISPRAMKTGMGLVFAVALLIGVYLTAVAGWIIVAIGVFSIASAIAYTGGPYPLGYHGLGDVFVMLFFGFVAVCGTVFVNTGGVPMLAVWCSLPVGALATNILVVNNVRDVETDRVAGKRTLVVRFGRRAGIAQYLTLLGLAYAVPAALWSSGVLSCFAFLPWLSLPLAWNLARKLRREQGQALNATLAGSAKLLMLYGLLFGVSVALGIGPR
ncbi:MAG: hypothetical protein RJA70_186 [Pseudomonadota bacterium]|jgi:1,4-dihydroxy-2-naphthoate octaprenyltransferase